MKLGEHLCYVLGVISMFLAAGSGFSVYIMVIKNIGGVPFVFGIFVISIVSFLGFFLYGMRYYGEWN